MEDDDDEDGDFHDDDGKDDVKEEVVGVDHDGGNINCNDDGMMADDLKRYAKRIIIRNECKTVPITKISPKDPKIGIQPAEVPLKLCICGQMDSSVMIKGILEHLVSANRTILDCCTTKSDRSNSNQNEADHEEDEELYRNMKENVIALSHIARKSDVVDIEEAELLSILQECSQQSLEYDVDSKFEMNLSLLETKLNERYIIGRKIISLALNDLEFEFAGHHDIQSYIDRTNHKYATARGGGNGSDIKYFEDCSQDLIDVVISRLQLRFDRKAKSKDNLESELRFIKSAKNGIEQTLVALLRWQELPPQHSTRIATFMKENLRLYEEEYQLFDSMHDLLMLKHCEALWKLLDRLHKLREGKWSQVPPDIPAIFKQPIGREQIRNELRQWVNTCDVDQMLDLLIEWKAFMEEVLLSGDHIQHAQNSQLSMWLQFYSVNVDLEKDSKSKASNFPQDIMLMHCVSAYKIAADQFQERNKLIAS